MTYDMRTITVVAHSHTHITQVTSISTFQCSKGTFVITYVIKTMFNLTNSVTINLTAVDRSSCW